MMKTANLTTGQKVTVKDRDHTAIGTVKKITPGGQAVVTMPSGTEVRFSASGREVGGGLWLDETPVEETRKLIAKRNRYIEALRAFRAIRDRHSGITTKAEALAEVEALEALIKAARTAAEAMHDEEK